jgi:hypothetical protein
MVMCENYPRWLLCAAIICCLGFALAGSARAEVLDLSATCQATVTENSPNGPGQTDTHTELYRQTTSVLPMSTEASITTHAGDQVTGLGLSYCRFEDPFSTADSTPHELNADVATFSDDAALGYDVNSVVTETRKVRFTPEQTQRALGQEVEFISTFYVRGLLIAFARNSGMNLSGLVARMEITVTHARPGRPEQTAMTAVYELVGQSDGTVKLNTSGKAQPGQVIDLELGGVVPEFPVLRLALLSDVAIEYRYTGTVGEESSLNAALRLTLVSLPGGTGAAGVLGMPGEMLGRLQSVLGLKTASALVRSVNKEIVKLPAAGVDPLVDPEQQSGPPAFLAWFTRLCGGLGAESIVGIALMLGWMALSRRRL